MEIITAAAVCIDGKIWTDPQPARHADILFRIFDETGEIAGADDQGFVTDTGRFVDRHEAHEIAVRAGQIKEGKWGHELFSEDLW